MSIADTLPWQLAQEGLLVRIHLQPRAAHNRLIGLYGQSLKITLTAPPLQNAANIALLKFLSTLLHLPRSSFSLVDGAKSRAKRVLISTSTPATLIQSLEELLTTVDKKSMDG